MRSPRISLPTHGLLELAAGAALLLVGFIADLGGAGTVLTFVAGIALMGIGLGAVQSLPLSTHQAIDRGLVVALAAGAVCAALLDAGTAAVLLLVVAAALFVLEAVTRWSRPAPRGA